MLRNFLLVGAGGAAGSMARYAVGYMFGRYLPSAFPLGTFAINIIGSLIIGVLFGLAGRNNWLQVTGMLLLASGFCGGFTTFSSFALDNVTLMQKGQTTIAIIYTGMSIVLGLLACKAGIWLANSSL